MPDINLLHAVAYSSQARRPMSTAEIDDLVVSSSAYNSALGVTGVLLNDGQKFFQYIEGPPEGIREAYKRIRKASSHDILAEVYNGPVAQRYFRDWVMASRKAQPGTILQLSAARWSRTLMMLNNQAERPAPLQMLVDFWDGAA